MAPNVILIVLDSARADAFEPYGAAPGSSPAVAQLASSGAAWQDVFATASWTIPSHASIFTGLLPRAAGMHGTPGMGLGDMAAPIRSHADRFLPEVLRRAGYRTGAVSANLWISPQSGFDLGFERFAAIDSGRQAAMHAASRYDRLKWIQEGIRARVDDGAAEAGRTLRGWIDDLQTDRPFFWFVNLVECHSPYLPPRPYNDLGLVDRVRAAAEARRHLNLAAIWRACAGGAPIDAAVLARMRRLYAGATRYLDAWLGEVVEALESRGVLDETVVIVTADHGENLGEGGLITHALSLDDRLLRVPFVLSGPGTREAAPIRSLGQLPRLIAELSGLDQHPWPADALPVDAAVAQLDPPADPEDRRTGEFARMHGLDAEGIQLLTTSATCATDGRFKLVRRAEREQLFDLRIDPLELHPREPPSDGGGSDDAASAVVRLRQALSHPSVLSSAGFSPEAAEEPSDPEELHRLEERMRLLGYL